MSMHKETKMVVTLVLRLPNSKHHFRSLGVRDTPMDNIIMCIHTNST